MVIKNKIKTKGSHELCDEVINQGLCFNCGSCVSLCPYFRINRLRGVVRRVDICERDEGRCYLYCPRTPTDVDAIYQRIFGVSYSEDSVGVGMVREIFLGRSKDADILKKAQDGGSVTTLLYAAMRAGIIDAAVETKNAPEQSPAGFVARNKKELLQGAGSRYESSFVLEALNRLPSDSTEKLAVVGLPCQVTAASKMKTYPHTSGINVDNIKLVVGLFCGWSLSPGPFYQFLVENFDLSRVVKFDIPHHPAHSFDVYTTSGKREIDLDDIQNFINPACSYCCDMTAQFADISVGSGRAMFHGWNTIIVRTNAGAKVVAEAKKLGLLETQPIPQESVTNLKRAALNKIRRAVKKLAEQTGSEQDLGYLTVKPGILEAALKE